MRRRRSGSELYVMRPDDLQSRLELAKPDHTGGVKKRKEGERKGKE